MNRVRRSQGERKAKSYQRLLSSAKQILSEKGYAGATIEEIVKNAGYSQGAFYNHWSSKDNMVIDIIKQVASEQIELLNNHTMDSQHIFDNLTKISGDPKLFFELWLIAVRGHPIAPFLIEHYKAWRQYIFEYILKPRHDRQSDLQPPTTSDDRIRHKATMLIALFDGLLIQHQLDPDLLSTPDFNDIYDQFLKTLVEV